MKRVCGHVYKRHFQKWASLHTALYDWDIFCTESYSWSSWACQNTNYWPCERTSLWLQASCLVLKFTYKHLFIFHLAHETLQKGERERKVRWVCFSLPQFWFCVHAVISKKCQTAVCWTHMKKTCKSVFWSVLGLPEILPHIGVFGVCGFSI